MKRTPTSRKRNGRIRILIADDHFIVRWGLASLLRCESDFEVVGEATDGEEAIVLSRSLRPDVLILDLMMPRKSGVEVVQTLQGECPKTRILILTAFADGDEAKQVLSAGAAKVLSKDTSRETLVDAIRQTFAPPPPLPETSKRESVRRPGSRSVTLKS